MARLNLVDGFIDEGTLEQARTELRDVRAQREALIAEYIKLGVREGALVNRLAELADRIAKPFVRPERPIKPTVSKRRLPRCRACGETILPPLDICRRCESEEAIVAAMEDAEYY